MSEELLIALLQPPYWGARVSVAHKDGKPFIVAAKLNQQKQIESRILAEMAIDRTLLQRGLVIAENKKELLSVQRHTVRLIEAGLEDLRRPKALPAADEKP
jgi:hypothetical protein